MFEEDEILVCHIFSIIVTCISAFVPEKCLLKMAIRVYQTPVKIIAVKMTKRVRVTLMGPTLASAHQGTKKTRQTFVLT